MVLHEKDVRVVKVTYEDRDTVVRCLVGGTDGYKVVVGLHVRSALSTSVFAAVVDRLTGEVTHVCRQQWD